MPDLNSYPGQPPRRIRRAGKALAVVPSLVAGSLAAAATESPAAAFPQALNNCNDRTIDWYFSDDWGTRPTARGWAEAAIGLWNQPLDFNGSQLVEVVHDQDNPGGVQNVEVDLEFHETTYGSSECDLGARIWINSRWAGIKSFVWKVSKHEMGHLIGAEHTGAKDSYGNVPGGTASDNAPIMSTCIDRSNFSDTHNIFSQDDYAYLNWQHSATTNRQATANWGFEQGTRFWGLKNLSATGNDKLEHVTSGGATGPGYIRHKNIDGSVIFQTVNIATDGDDEQYTPWWTNNNGWIIGSLFTDSTATGTSWTWIGGAWFNPASQDGYRMQALIGATYQSPSWVDFDNVRIEGT